MKRTICEQSEKKIEENSNEKDQTKKKTTETKKFK